MTNSIPFKLFLALALLSATLFYSQYHNKSMKQYFDSSEEYVLKELPNMDLHEIYSGKKGSLKSILPSENQGLLVHFWGTWCGPCEEELPAFIELMKSFEEKNVSAILFAINDQEVKVKKFLKEKIGDLPSNILVAVDNEGISLKRFGTLKVPETYAFSGAGSMVKKFVGPQEWNAPYFSDYLGSVFKTSP